MEKPIFPMRINKYLAWKKYGTRSEADELIKKKLVLINDRIAVLGDKVNKGDTVEVRPRKKALKRLYFAYNKPQGVITHSPQQGEKDILQSSALTGIFPVGRLDKDSYGLIILTNDGRITDRLLNPLHVHEKEYEVTTKNKFSHGFAQKMEKGVDIGGYTTKKCQISLLNSNTFRIILTEGKKHQIRLMCSALGNPVTDLKRIRVMNITLGQLKANAYRPIEGKELEIFLKSLGL